MGGGLHDEIFHCPCLGDPRLHVDDRASSREDERFDTCVESKLHIDKAKDCSVGLSAM